MLAVSLKCDIIHIDRPAAYLPNAGGIAVINCCSSRSGLDGTPEQQGSLFYTFFHGQRLSLLAHFDTIAPGWIAVPAGPLA